MPEQRLYCGDIVASNKRDNSILVVCSQAVGIRIDSAHVKHSCKEHDMVVIRNTRLMDCLLESIANDPSFVEELTLLELAD